MTGLPPSEPPGTGSGPGPGPDGPPPPAGWYPEPGGTQRYWDGRAWTQHVAPLAPVPVRPTSQDDQTIAMVAHLGGAFASILVPILIYATRKDRSPFVRHHAAEAVNFHLTLYLYVVVSVVLMLVLIGFVLFFLVVLWFIVLTIVASIAAYQGQWYRYPLTIRFFS